MRRKVGIQGIQRQKQTEKQYQAVGQEIEADQIKEMTAQLAVFKQNLEEFAKKYRKDINKDPEFRKYFQEMCSKIGVDPLASNKGFWAEMLGVGDFYYELGVQIIEVCYRTRAVNGGFIEINELCTHLQNRRGKAATPIITDDIERSVKKLKVLGNGFNLLSIGNRKILQSVPCELAIDHTTVLLQAEDTGNITRSKLEKELGWTKQRTENALNLLLQQGIAWLDIVPGAEDSYWFPSLLGSTLSW
eukprot:Phypoly_transcript_16524.p1 GENE.Phypoly_transcript_16524~~Phypoly_transcript_16524.p1  ORF type:complete len:259 (-),score=38.29 Phypoly_transcript_16524:84-821(-)